MATIYWAGDSTVQFNNITTYPQTGMGQVLPLYLKPEVKVENHAKIGRSTKSFLSDGRLLAIEERISEGDFLFIQFGHNDEKIQDPARYTEPFSDYISNLEIFINAAREKKAFPVLITPLERRCFQENGQLEAGEHCDYVKAMKQTADNLNVPLIDLYSMSREKLMEAGIQKTTEWYMHIPAGRYPSRPDGLADNTHLQYDGAVVFAGCVAQGLKELGGMYRDLLLDELNK